MREKMFMKLRKEFGEDGSATTEISFDTAIIQDGILAKLTSSELKVLMVIASHMDDNGLAFPSMDRIVVLAGISKPTVVSAVKGLMELRIDGVPIFTRTLKGTGARQSSIYNFVIDLDNPVSEIIEKEVVDKSRKTSKQFVEYYCKIYKETFGVDYKVMWARDLSKMKTLTLTYTDEQIEAMVFTAITEYKKRWANPNFPAPTIGQVTSWMGVQALTVYNNKQKLTKRDTKWDKFDTNEEISL